MTARRAEPEKERRSEVPASRRAEAPASRRAPSTDPSIPGDPPVAIASVANERVKAAVRLRDRRERDLTGCTLVDGAREIGRAIAAGVEVVTLFLAPGLASGPEARATLAATTAAGVVPTTVSDRVMERLGFGDRSDGLVAVVRPDRISLAGLALPSAPLLLVADGIEKPGNLGALLRSADGAGADAVLVTGPGTDVWNPNAIRASLGTIFRLRPVVAPRDEIRTWLAGRGIRVVAARVGAPLRYDEADLAGPLAIVVGSEAEGLGDAWSGPDVIPVALPMRGAADSLNVSVAAAILLYEARRQRSVSAR